MRSRITRRMTRLLSDFLVIPPCVVTPSPLDAAVTDASDCVPVAKRTTYASFLSPASTVKSPALSVSAESVLTSTSDCGW